MEIGLNKKGCRWICLNKVIDSAFHKSIPHLLLLLLLSPGVVDVYPSLYRCAAVNRGAAGPAAEWSTAAGACEDLQETGGGVSTKSNVLGFLGSGFWSCGVRARSRSQQRCRWPYGSVASCCWGL
jgi:hypothetical protein